MATLKAERTQVAATGRQAETEAAPIRYVAELVGADTDSELAIRWLIALMVLCCDRVDGRSLGQAVTGILGSAPFSTAMQQGGISPQGGEHS